MLKTVKQITFFDEMIGEEEYVTLLDPAVERDLDKRVARGEITREEKWALIVKLENEAQRISKIERSITFQAQTILEQVPGKMVGRGLPSAHIHVYQVRNDPSSWEVANSPISNEFHSRVWIPAPRFWLQYSKIKEDIDLFKLARLYLAASAFLETQEPQHREQYAFEFGKLSERYDLHATHLGDVTVGQKVREGGKKGRAERAKWRSDKINARYAMMDELISNGSKVMAAAREVSKLHGGSVAANRRLWYDHKK